MTEMMGARYDNRDKVADDIYHDRRIRSSTYCGRCGYNLKTLPHVYTCPECGAAYNARFPNMQGVFLFDNLSFPWGDVFASAALLGATAVLGLFAYAGRSGDWLMIAFLLGIPTAIYVVIVAKMIRQFIRYLVIARRIARDECEGG